jgi:hypothetical protein
MMKYYGINDQEILNEDIDECVVDYLESMELEEIPQTVMVEEYTEMKITSQCFDHALEYLEEALWENYGDPYGDILSIPSISMPLWEEFVKSVKANCQVRACEKTGESTEVKTAQV